MQTNVRTTITHPPSVACSSVNAKVRTAVLGNANADTTRRARRASDLGLVVDVLREEAPADAVTSVDHALRVVKDRLST